MSIKKNDFIKMDYEAYAEDILFDTTDEKKAKEAGLNTKNKKLEPLVFAVGNGHVLKGLDNKLIGLDVGTHKIKLSPEEAFGKKNSKLLKLMPMSLFKKQKINPFVGLELNIDDSLGIVRSVSGGRVIVDFNHPLASKEVEYKINILEKVEDDEQKAKALLKTLQLPYKKLEVKDKKANLDLDFELPKQFTDNFSKQFKEITKLDLNISMPKKEEKKEDKETKKSEDKKV